jgi:hypothetical protein
MLSDNRSSFKTLENKSFLIIFGYGWIIYIKIDFWPWKRVFLFPLFDILSFIDL